MPRVSKVDSCLVCGETPCACNRKKAKSNLSLPQSPAPIVKPEKLEIPKLRPQVTRYEAPQSTHHATLVSEDDLVLVAALRNLEPIMSDESREQFHAQLMTPVTPEERKAFWKERRNALRH